MASVTGGNDVRATPSTFTFPAPNPGWVIARNGGQPIIDIEGDAPMARDIVGDAANPALYIASDATHLYFRLRLDVDPRQNATMIGAAGWGCVINTDNDPTTYEYSTIFDGVNNPDSIYFYKNTVTATTNDPGDPPDTPPITVVTSPLTMAVGHAEVVQIMPGAFGDNNNIDNDYFIDWAIEIAPLMMAGFNPANPANYSCGSADNGTIVGIDCTGTPFGGSGCGPLETTFTDPITCGPQGCAICGDGQKGATEGCDDGNRTNGDGCNSVCLLELGRACMGMGSACASEFCDPTNMMCACDADADCAMGQLCATVPNPNACVPPGCGNTVIEVGEGCDDGNKTSGDGCNAVCSKELGQACGADMVCASGFCDPDGGVCACDQNTDCPMSNVCNVQATPNACVAPGCGNHVLEMGEGCDDGNTMSGDGCNSTCRIELLQGCTTSPSCASGFCDLTVNQCTCDANADCGANQTCNLMLNPNQCVPNGCGNGITDILLGESCDDGGTTPGDGCNAQCLLEFGQTCALGTQCASGFCDMLVCACDDNVDCPGFQVCNTQANPNTCVNPGCGNQVVEPGEGCDDGNIMNGDGCNDACSREIGEACSTSDQCVSGTCDPMDNSCVCDENSDCPSGTPICKFSTDPNVCVFAGCGNGVVEGIEGCDDDNMTSGDGCSNSCLLELGQVCPGGSTTCESGYCDPIGTTCACDQDADCPITQSCYVTTSPHACVERGCGNGVVEMGEGCDDNNMTNEDGCTSTCLLEMGLPCPDGSMTCASGFCDSADTTCACDQDADCPSGTACNTTAEPNVCMPITCGNGTLDANEGCDDGNTTAGDGCNTACLIELGKSCDMSTSCASGLCDANVCVCARDIDCAPGEFCDTTADPNICSAAGCGNGTVEANEGCDDGNTMPGDGCDPMCAKELGQPCADGSECSSMNCDGASKKCVCSKDADCAMGETCDTAVNPHACVPSDGCRMDSDCPGGIFCDEPSGSCVECTRDTECTDARVCDESSFTCVQMQCTQDSDCGDGICVAQTHTCMAKPVILEGGGIACTTSSTSSGSNGLPLSLFGLLGLGLLRRRRH